MTNDLSTLINNLNSNDVGVRGNAAERLSRLGEQAKAALVGLCRAASDEDETVREHAVAALEEVGVPDGEDAAELILLLQSSDADTVYWAVTLLGRLESSASHAAELLAKLLLDSPHLLVKQRVAWALKKIGNQSDSVIQALRHAAQSPDARLSRNAQKALSILERLADSILKPAGG